MSVYIFHRIDGFYPLELKDDAEAVANAKCNKGTIKVTDALAGKVIWSDDPSTTTTSQTESGI